MLVNNWEKDTKQRKKAEKTLDFFEKSARSAHLLVVLPYFSAIKA